MNEKYTEIIQLVHPLFDSFFSRNYGIKFRTREDILNHIKNNKEELIAINTTLKAYKRAIDVIKTKRPNALFVIILPAEEEKYSGKEPVAAYEKVVKQILDYAHKQLGERAVLTDFAPKLAGHTQFIKPEMYERLNKDLKLYSFGEYGNACVSTWKDHVSNKLTEKMFNVTKEKILSNYTITNYKKPKTYLDKKIKAKQERYNRKITARKSLAK